MQISPFQTYTFDELDADGINPVALGVPPINPAKQRYRRWLGLNIITALATPQALKALEHMKIEEETNHAEQIQEKPEAGWARDIVSAAEERSVVLRLPARRPENERIIQDDLARYRRSRGAAAE